MPSSVLACRTVLTPGAAGDVLHPWTRQRHAERSRPVHSLAFCVAMPCSNMHTAATQEALDRAGFCSVLNSG